MVSFIIPVYNCKNYIETCVDSILSIRNENIEVLLVDDGSSDGSSELCECLAEKYSSVICIHQENKGVSTARNIGIKSAKGQYVIFIDSDDKIETNVIKKSIELIENYPSVDMLIYGISFDYYHNANCYRSDVLLPTLSGEYHLDNCFECLFDLYKSNSLSPVWNKIIRKDLLISNQLQFRNDMFLYEDLEFSLRCMAKCNYLYFLQDVGYHYRQSEDEGNAGRRLKKIEHIPYLIDKIEKSLRLLDKSFSSQCEDILQFLYLVLAREKISVSSISEIEIVCNDYSTWICTRKFRSCVVNDQYAKTILDKKIYNLYFGSLYIKVRHKIAVWIKNTNLYKKIKNNT